MKINTDDTTDTEIFAGLEIEPLDLNVDKCKDAMTNDKCHAKKFAPLHLPTEIWLDIMSYLDGMALILAGEVCRRWYRMYFIDD
jgi:F-box-like